MDNSLERFVEAQASTYAQARAELAAGEKRSHWMWFIFPQMRGLGSSSMAERYGIASFEEAEAYLAHPLLGPRLQESTALVLAVPNRSVGSIFGYPDDLKFHSSMTLFAAASHGDGSIFRRALEMYFDGLEDAGTMRLLGQVSLRTPS